MNEKEKDTLIQISKNLAKELKTIKIAKLETYHEIIERLLKFYKENKK